jgi:hypothetical protein
MTVACHCSLLSPKYEHGNRGELKIPHTAKWLGGKDGGVWVDINIESVKSFSIKIYNDSTGDMIGEEFYASECQKIEKGQVFDSLIGYGDKLIWSVDGIDKCIRRVFAPQQDAPRSR